MNRLFSELFRKFGAVCLEVCETISRGIREVFGGQMKENYPETNRKQIRKSLLDIIEHSSTGCRGLKNTSQLDLPEVFLNLVFIVFDIFW